ncbi:MAG TPA: GntG family PLP-dependent aldolase [Bryobacteraceae bacterium]
MIDLRSDTVTKPTAAMRQAMAEAEVGDDVYGEDPTINRLERRAAEILEKEAALFVPTGTMGNTIGIKLNTRHGEEVICDDRAHILDWELSMTAWFSGCLVRAVPSADGILTWRAIEPMLRHGGPHSAGTALIHLEHPHNMGGGTLYPIEEIDHICDRAHALGMRVHMDGARLFNAVAASGLSAARIAAKVDTVMFCLSKGLGAPVGSVLAGTAGAMEQGRLYRKRLGGGMRQGGVLAAAGLVALERMPARLAEDHAHAKLLAEGLAALPGISIDPAKVVTNIVIFDIGGSGIEPKAFVAAARDRGVQLSGVGGTRIRMVTHLDVSRQDCRQALEAVGSILS